MALQIIPSLFQNEFMVRSVVKADGSIWVCCKDVASILEVESSYRNFLSSLDDDEKGVEIIHTAGGTQNISFISESALYKMIFKSRKPVAKAFTKWVTSEVLPSLRKTGEYKMHDTSSTIKQIEQLYNFHKELGLDERDVLFYKDQIRNEQLRLTTGQQPKEQKERVCLPLSDMAKELGFNLNLNQLKALGSVVADKYKSKHGKAPIKREQHVEGASRMVNHYTSDDKKLIKKCIEAYMAKQ